MALDLVPQGLSTVLWLLGNGEPSTHPGWEWQDTWTLNWQRHPWCNTGASVPPWYLGYHAIEVRLSFGYVDAICDWLWTARTSTRTPTVLLRSTTAQRQTKEALSVEINGPPQTDSRQRRDQWEETATPPGHGDLWKTHEDRQSSTGYD